jgi:hypothetical protein
MNGIDGNTRVTPQQPNYDTGNLDQLDGTQQKPGLGQASIYGAKPEVRQEAMRQTQVTLLRIAPSLTGDQLDVTLASVTLEMKDKVQETEKEKIKLTTSEKQAAIEERQAKIEDAAKKREEAREARENASIWQKIGFAFAIIGVALAAVALAATGAGAVMTGVLIAALVVSVVMAVDSGMATFGENGGLAGELHKAFNPDASAEDIAKANEIFGYTMLAVSLVLAVAALGPAIKSGITTAVRKVGGEVAEEAAKQAVKNAMNKVDDFLQPLQKMGQKAQSGLQKIDDFLQPIRDKAAKFQKIMTGIEAGAATMETGHKIGTTIATTDALNKSADAKDAQAVTLRQNAVIEVLDDLIDQAITELMARGNVFAGMLDATVENMNDRGSTLARARFAG